MRTMTTFGTLVNTYFNGRFVGEDVDGNKYYEQKRDPGPNYRRRRWVLYKATPEASRVPPEWHAWLHYTTATPLPASARQKWQTPHEMNLTGTPESYRPPGHDYRGGHRAAATGDYEAWTPES